MTNDIVAGRSHNFINMSGLKVGRLFVTEDFEMRNEKNGGGILKPRPYWKCICDCGNTCFVNSRNLRLSKTKSCGCLKKEDSSRKATEMVLPDSGEHKNYIFKTYKRNATSRHIEFNLSKDQFVEFLSKSCRYCGIGPSTIRVNRSGRTFPYNGVDRVDNTLGYELENCVPCCTPCNRAKSDMTEEEFLLWIERVHNHASRETC